MEKDIVSALKKIGFHFGIILGDVNMRDKENEIISHIDNDYIDLWRLLHPEDPGLTHVKTSLYNC